MNDGANISVLSSRTLGGNLTIPCRDEESFTLFTRHQPFLRGCYLPQDKHLGQVLYTSDDHTDSGENVIAAAQIDNDDPENVSVAVAALIFCIKTLERTAVEYSTILSTLLFSHHIIATSRVAKTNLQRLPWRESV